ncbi:MAG TPA: hypothetical protein VN158_17400, partial [Caulobacter sp.]|nr:hypothetical protein [Caulobacter sp.]
MITPLESLALDRPDRPVLDRDQGFRTKPTYTQPMGAGIVQIDRFSAPKAWLEQIGQNAGPASGRARLFTLLDGLAA